MNEIGAFSNGQIFETIKFGFPGETLLFTGSPVEVRIRVSATDGTTLQVKRKGNTGGWTTEGLTSSGATCTAGNPSVANNSYNVQNGVIKVYTCRASDFAAYTQGTNQNSGTTIRPIVTTIVEPVEETPTQETTPTQEEPQVTQPVGEELQVETTQEEQASGPTGLFGLGALESIVPLGLIALVLIGLVVLVLKGKTVTKKRK